MFLVLPLEIVELILFYLEAKDLLNIEATCKFFCSLLSTNFWRRRGKKEGKITDTKYNFVASSLKDKYLNMILKKFRHKAEGALGNFPDKNITVGFSYIELEPPESCCFTFDHYKRKVKAFSNHEFGVSFWCFRICSTNEDKITGANLVYNFTDAQTKERYQSREAMVQHYKLFLQKGWIATGKLKIKKSVGERICRLWDKSEESEFVLALTQTKHF
jgi:hypothetical protein